MWDQKLQAFLATKHSECHLAGPLDTALKCPGDLCQVLKLSALSESTVLKLK
jgi:hypothetical protein